MSTLKKLIALGLSSLAGALFVSFALAQSTNSSSAFHVNSQRLQGTLEKLSEFGRNPEGGVTRLGF